MLECERDSTAEYFGERIGGLPVTEVGAADKNERTFRCADPIRNSGRAAGSNRALHRTRHERESKSRS
jgi:hypothetical protein